MQTFTLVYKILMFFCTFCIDTSHYEMTSSKSRLYFCLNNGNYYSFEEHEFNFHYSLLVFHSPKPTLYP